MTIYFPLTKSSYAGVSSSKIKKMLIICICISVYLYTEINRRKDMNDLKEILANHEFNFASKQSEDSLDAASAAKIQVVTDTGSDIHLQTLQQERTDDNDLPTETTDINLRLQHGQDEQTIVKETDVISLLYDESCPLSQVEYMKDTEMTINTKQMVLAAGSSMLFRDASNRGMFRRRKFVFVGDSTYRQVFSAFACLAYAAGIWTGEDASTMGVVDRRGLFYDARFKTLGGGDFIFEPLAGKVQLYWDKHVQAEDLLGDYKFNPEEVARHPLISEEDWLQSCKSHQPFYVDAYRTYRKDDSTFRFYSPDASLEKVQLGKDDVVLINSGHHPTRTDNLKRVKELLNCMVNEQKSGKVDNLWPKVYYVASTLQHFDTGKNGKYDAKVKKPCLKSIESNPNLIEEQKMFSDFLLNDFNSALNKGWAHFSEVDCTHYVMPGVPDLYALEIMKEMIDKNI
mmetsp:Transcript_9247/g.13109  ORF Transcript_9247/g.13109 Transcript_9247/m.13109 type:complete len:456 (+) Transcript_9247:197-1564(+)